MNRSLLSVIVMGVLLAATFWWFGLESEEVASERPMVTVKIPANLEHVAAGQQIFEENCAACHGKNASGLDGNGPPLIHKIYEPSHHSDMSFYLAVQNGVRSHHWRFGNMPPVEDLSENEVSEIIAYVRTLQRANGIN